MTTRVCVSAVVLAIASLVGAGQSPDAERTTLDRMHARMYRAKSAEVWRAVPDVVKSLNLVFPRISARDQLLTAWVLQPLTTPKERRSELRVFVSPFAEPARVYVGSVMREATPDDPRAERVRYNAGELEAAFFTALERAIAQQGEPVPIAAPARAAAARRLLGAAADADECLKRLEDDEPLAMSAAGAILAPEKIKDSEAVPVYAGGKPRDKKAGQPRIDATIAEDGALIGARLIQTATTDEAYVQAVLGAASLWHYQPVKIDGCYVPVRLTLAVEGAAK